MVISWLVSSSETVIVIKGSDISVNTVWCEWHGVSRDDAEEEPTPCEVQLDRVSWVSKYSILYLYIKRKKNASLEF